MTRFNIITILVIVFLAIASGMFYTIYSFSGNNADISFENLALDDFDSQSFLNNLTINKKFKFNLTFKISGGIVPVTCKDFVLNVKLEDFTIGSVKLNDFDINGEKNETKTILLDISAQSSDELSSIRDNFYDFNEELKVQVEGSGIIDAIILSRNFSASITKYFLLGSPLINLVEASWNKTIADAGEIVNFHVTILNKYREKHIFGTLTVTIEEDITMWVDQDIKTYVFPVSLNKSESSEYTDSFAVYKNLNTRGFYLKIFWEGDPIYEMEESYPPRLSVS